MMAGRTYLRSRALIALVLCLFLVTQSGCVKMFLTGKGTAQRIEEHPSKRINYILYGYAWDVAWVFAFGIGVLFLIYDTIWLAGGWPERPNRHIGTGRYLLPPPPPDTGEQP